MNTYSPEQYRYALTRIEELLPIVSDDTPTNAPEAIELSLMSDIVIAYENEHFPLEELTTGSLIRIGLQEKKLSQKELAKMLNISPSRISDFVKGRGEPSLKLAGRICQILGIEPALMLGV